jgi:hypothetical protein
VSTDSGVAARFRCWAEGGRPQPIKGGGDDIAVSEAYMYRGEARASNWESGELHRLGEVERG